MKTIGIIGASSNVGSALVKKCYSKEIQIKLFQNKNSLNNFKDKAIIYNNLSFFFEDNDELISVIPIWIFRDLLIKNKSKIKFKKLLLLSSTSASTKINSEDIWEKNYAKKFLIAEEEIKKLCLELNITYTILRPSMIWGNKRDLNITFIMKFIVNYGLLILPSNGVGVRYPIHIEQLAESILDIYQRKKVGLINILGPEKLKYKDMCKRIFRWYGYHPLILIFPKYLKIFAVIFLKYIFRKPYINKSSFDRIDYSPSMQYGNPENYYSSGKFQPYKNDLLNKTIFASFIQKGFLSLKKLIFISNKE